MHFTGRIYRPPNEAMLNAKLLQVTVGCAHNKCRFCNMYRDVQFQVEPLWQIEEDIKELRATHKKIERIFLVNGDPFGLPTSYLKEITDKIIEYIAEIKVISMYASINNVKNKSDEDLLAIKDMRINDLWFGIETGNVENLAYINKGHKLEDIYTQLERLNEVGIRHNHCYILGVGGKGRGIENAMDTVKVINATKPSIVWYGSLGIFEGSDMPKEVEEGKFVPATELEILEEELTVLENIELKNIIFNGNHPSNLVSVYGILPSYRKLMINEIKDFIEYKGKDFLNSSFVRQAD